MKTYSIKIERFGITPKSNDLSNVVKYVAWRYVLTDGAKTVDLYKETVLEEPVGSSFTAFEELTKEQVISWIENIEDTDAMRLTLDTLLEKSYEPIMVERKVPWDERTYIPELAPHEADPIK